MKVMNIVQAVNDALDLKLSEDKNIVIYGEDVGVEGGVFRVTSGLQEKHGAHRVFDSPLAESGIVGSAVGMCAAGLRPIIEMQFSGFVYPAMNQIITHVSRMRNRTRGKYKMPMVVRMPYGGNIKALELHSESMEAIFGHIPGLKVIIPSTPYDAKGLLISAIEDDDPVIFMEPKKIYRAIKQEVPEEKYKLEIGKARILEEGKDLDNCNIRCNGKRGAESHNDAKKENISIELIDLRTIFPIDNETITNSIKKTGKLLIVSEGPTVLV